MIYEFVGATRPAEAKFSVDPEGSPVRCLGDE